MLSTEDSNLQHILISMLSTEDSNSQHIRISMLPTEDSNSQHTVINAIYRLYWRLQVTILFIPSAVY